MIRIFVIGVLLVLTGAVAAQDSALTPKQTERYHALISELRCVVCQNQSIAESGAPLAANMRDLVRRRIEAGQTDAEIKSFLVDRYGEWVLYDPPFQPATWLLWLGPALLLLVGLTVALLLWRRAGSRPEPSPPDQHAIERVLEDDGTNS